MKIKDLPKDKDISCVRIKLPPGVLKKFVAYCGGKSKMYAVGHCMGYGFMMSPDPPGDDRRLYPLPPTVKQEDILEWETC
jgi:hypothetical protein